MGNRAGVRVAGGQIAHPRGDVKPEQGAGRGRRAVPHSSAAPPAGLDGPAIAQQAVGRRGGVGVDAELNCHFPDRR